MGVKIFTLIGLALVIGCAEKHQIKYYENGEVHFKVPIENGERQGILEEFDEEGRLVTEYPYNQGVIEGIVKKYDSSGFLIETYEYLDNLENGSFKMYYSDGTTYVEGKYKEGKPDGKGYEYYPDGKLMRKYVYSMGDMIYMKAYSNEGVQYDSKLDVNISKTDGMDSVKIELGYTEFDSAGIIVVFGNLDSNKRLIDTLAIHGARDLDLKYKLGNYQKLLSGVLYEMKLPEETLEAAYYFEYTP